jgi:hypothetical protein
MKGPNAKKEAAPIDLTLSECVEVRTKLHELQNVSQTLKDKLAVVYRCDTRFKKAQQISLDIHTRVRDELLLMMDELDKILRGSTSNEPIKKPRPIAQISRITPGYEGARRNLIPSRTDFLRK